MCRTYEAQDGETVFGMTRVLGPIIVGVASMVFGIIFIIVVSQVFPSPVPLVGPILLLVIGFLIIAFNGGRWVVFHKDHDEVFFVKGYLFNFFTQKNLIGKITELTSVLTTVRVRMSRHHNSNTHHTTSTQVYRDVTFHFSTGASHMVGSYNIDSGSNDFVVKVKQWLDTNYPGHQVRCGDATSLLVNQHPVIVQQTLINPNQILEQELRSLIVQYQMSNDIDARAKGQKFNLAMEYNPNSLIGTYGALKQQNPVFTIQGEEVLLNNAQTIIDAKTNQVQVQFGNSTEGEGGNYYQ